MANNREAFIGKGGCRALIAGAAFVLSACAGCESGLGKPAESAAPERLVAAVWNLQALFDGVEDGTEYPDYSADSGWTEEKYRERLERIGEAVPLIEEGGPDLLALIEVENGSVLEDLAAGPLKGLGYGWHARASLPGAALGIAALSRYPIAAARVHGASVDGAELPRPILELRIETGSAPLVLLICHWKSKLGGDAATEPQRIAAAGVVARLLASIEAEAPGTDVLVLGDLNENYDEFDRRGGTELTALLSDDPAAAALAAAAPPGPRLVLSVEKPPVARSVSLAIPVHTPWPDSAWPGSYVYRGAWETIDHALAPACLFDGAGWEFSGFRVADAACLTGDDGFPLAYNLRTGGGFSDHLPLAVELTRIP